jgi:hypothetical protein
MDFNTSLSNSKNVFGEFIYTKLDNSLKEYLDESVIDDNNTINFKKAAGIAQFQFLRILPEGIFEYENFMREQALKMMQNPNFKDVEGSIAQYTELMSLRAASSNQGSARYPELRAISRSEARREEIAGLRADSTLPREPVSGFLGLIPNFRRYYVV